VIIAAVVLQFVLLLIGYSSGASALEIFANADSRTATDGFYAEERAGGQTWSWTKPHAVLAIPTLERGVPWTFTTHLLRMRPANAPSPTVRITIDGRLVAESRLDAAAADMKASVAARSGRGATIAIDVSPSFVPGVADTRELGVAVASMSLRRGASVAWPPTATVVGGSIALAALAALLLAGDIPLLWTAAFLCVGAAGQAWLLTRPVLLYAPYPVAVVTSYLALVAAAILAIASRRRSIAGEPAATVRSWKHSDRVGTRWRWLAIAIVALVYAVACRIMLAPVFNFHALTTASYEGDARVFIWALAWDNHAILDRAASLFDANVLYPLPHALAYYEHVFAISLFALPIYAATRNPVLAYNVVWIFCFLTTALAVHELAWRVTRDHLASLVAGMSFTFCFFRMHHAHHIELIWCAFIPLSLIAIERWVRRPTWGRLAVIVAMVVLQGLSGWYEAVFIAMADLLFLAWLVGAERWTIEPRRFVTHGVVAAAVTLLIVWPFARHYFGLHQASPAYSAGASADLVGWLVPPENTFAGQWLLARHIAGPRPIWGEVTVYLGWVTLLLAIAGSTITIRKRNVAHGGCFVVLALVAAALALGPSPIEVATGRFASSLFGLLSHVPGISVFRNPARYTELVSLALAVLAAIACAAAHRRLGLVARAGSVLAIGLLLAENYVVKLPGGPPQPFTVPAI
jgi:hypothetical protein